MYQIYINLDNVKFIKLQNLILIYIIVFYYILKLYIFNIFLCIANWMEQNTISEFYFQIKVSGIIFFNFGPPEEPVENK